MWCQPFRYILASLTTERRQTIDKTHDLAIHTIEPRRFFGQLNMYQRPLVDQPGPDRELINQVRRQGVREPIIVFNAAHLNELWLIEGDRRVQAAKLAGLDTISAIVCRTFDELAAALWDMKDRWDTRGVDETFSPMLASHKLQWGLILRGVKKYIRRYDSIAGQGYKLPNAATPLASLLEIVDINANRWRSLRLLGAVYVNYDHTQSRDTNVSLAAELLAKVDSGELSYSQAELRYRSQTLSHWNQNEQPISSAAWIKQMTAVTDSLDVLTKQLETLRTPPPDLSVDELNFWLEKIRQVRNPLTRMESTVRICIAQKEVTR